MFSVSCVKWRENLSS